MPTMHVTEDEAALLAQMRQWSSGIPEEALGRGKESAVYVSLIAARAQLVIDALNYRMNDYIERQDLMLRLLSPHVLLRLCQGWHDAQEYERAEDVH